MITPRYYQADAVDALFRYFAEKAGNPLVCMPTGTGKSVVIALFAQRAIYQYPVTRIIVATHVKELVANNYGKLMQAWPEAPAGVYSASLKRRDLGRQISFVGIGSVYKRAADFGHIDLLVIDEADLVSPESGTKYQQFILGLLQFNPRLKIIGLTATWWRIGQGTLTQGDHAIFTDIAVNYCTPDWIARLIHEGFLVAPIPQPTHAKIDTSRVGMSSSTGDFNSAELQRASNENNLNHAIAREAIARSQGRQSWITFCAGIEHAEAMAEVFNYYGIPTAYVHSKMSQEARDEAINGFKAGRYRNLTNNDIFTTGQDHPPIDLLIACRATMSSRLWVQMVGRGMRPYDPRSPGDVDPFAFPNFKQNCLVLDFAGNTLRCGPIDDPVMPRPKGDKTPGDTPIKICDTCGTYNHTRVRFCIMCGSEFTFESKITTKVSTAELISGGVPIVETFKVDRVMYNRHVNKKTGNVSIRVSYLCGLKMFTEYVSFDAHTAKPYAIHHAHEWWKQRHAGEPPLSTDLALSMQAQLRTPTRIRVWVNRPMPQVLSHEY